MSHWPPLSTTTFYHAASMIRPFYLVITDLKTTSRSTSDGCRLLVPLSCPPWTTTLERWCRQSMIRHRRLRSGGKPARITRNRFECQSDAAWSLEISMRWCTRYLRLCSKLYEVKGSITAIHSHPESTRPHQSRDRRVVADPQSKQTPHDSHFT